MKEITDFEEPYILVEEPIHQFFTYSRITLGEEITYLRTCLFVIQQKATDVKSEQLARDFLTESYKRVKL